MLCLTNQVGQAKPLIQIYNYTPAPIITPLQLVSLSPRDRQEFTGESPQGVEAMFTLAVDPARSDIKVYDPYNNVVSGEKQFPKDAHMAVSLPPTLYAGSYRIVWNAASGENAISGTAYFTIY